MVQDPLVLKPEPKVWHAKIPKTIEESKEYAPKTKIEKFLNNLARKRGYPIRPISEEDLRNIRKFLLSPETRGKTLFGSPFHYGFAYGFYTQAARRTPLPYIFTIGKHGRKGFFIITTRRRGKTPFVILSPVGKVATKLARFAQDLANASKHYVVVKKPELSLEKKLARYGFGDYRTGYKWTAKAPRDDDTYRSPVILLENVFRAGGRLRREIKRRHREFYNSLRKKFGEDAKIILEQYDPHLHFKDARQVLRAWAPEFAKRTGEHPRTAYAANEVYLHTKPDFENIATYIMYLETKEKKIPLGFTAFERTGFLTPKSIEIMKKNIPPGSINVDYDPYENLKGYLKLYRRAWKYKGPHSSMALTASVAITKKVRQAGFMLLYESLKRLYEKGKAGPYALVNLGGSESRGLHNFKLDFGPLFVLRNWHLVLYPKKK